MFWLNEFCLLFYVVKLEKSTHKLTKKIPFTRYKQINAYLENVYNNLSFCTTFMFLSVVLKLNATVSLLWLSKDPGTKSR